MLRDAIRTDVPPGEVATSTKRDVVLGMVAGTIGLGCCLYPVVLVLLGLSSASAAVDLGNRLYGDWGWAFKTAAVGFAGTALVVQRRRAKQCSVDGRMSVRKNAVVMAGVGLGTFGLLYAVTKGLSALA